MFLKDISSFLKANFEMSLLCYFLVEAFCLFSSSTKRSLFIILKTFIDITTKKEEYIVSSWTSPIAYCATPPP